MGNQIRTTILLAVMTALIIWVGQLLGGRQGMVIAFILAAGMNFFSYWFSDKLVLKMYRASEVTPGQSPRLYEALQRLTQRAGLPMPKLYIIPQSTPNAFATGRNPDHAVVAVTDGLLNLMDHKEIEGVLAHELAHVKNRDILIGSIAATMAGAIMILASMARWSAIFGGGSHDEEGGGGRYNRTDRNVHYCAYGCHDHPDGHIAIPGISGRCHRCKFCGSSGRAGERPGEAGCLFKKTSHGGQSIHSPHVYCQSLIGPQHDEMVFNSSPPGRTYCAAARHAAKPGR